MDPQMTSEWIAQRNPNGKVYEDPITNFLYIQGSDYKLLKYRDLFENFQIIQGATS